jgi:hypothetical protein
VLAKPYRSNFPQDHCGDFATGWTFRGSNPGGGEIFRSRPDRPWGPPSLLYNGYRVYFPGVKRQGRGVDHPPPSSAEIKEKVELYLYSPSGPSWLVLGRTLPLPLPFTVAVALLAAAVKVFCGRLSSRRCV